MSWVRALGVLAALCCVPRVPPVATPAATTFQVYKAPVAFPDGSQEAEAWACRREHTPVGQSDIIVCIELGRFLYEVGLNTGPDAGN